MAERKTLDDTQKIPRRYPDGLTLNQINILRLLEGDGRLTGDELAEELSLSPETIKKNIGKLRQQSLIKRVGSDKRGHWEVQLKSPS